MEHNGVKKQGESIGWSRNGFEIDGAKKYYLPTIAMNHIFIDQ